MRIDIATLFPDMLAPLFQRVIGRGVKSGVLDIRVTNIRDYAGNKHNRVDSPPCGGGYGMVMQAEPVYNCIRDITEADTPVIYMSPQGERFCQSVARELALLPRFAVLCGHYEGVDRRVLDALNVREVSVGDYVVTGGELPAMVVIDAVCRLVAGVLPSEDVFTRESHWTEGVLEHPQYTRPAVWRGVAVPDVLLSGNHAEIEKWKAGNNVKVERSENG